MEKLLTIKECAEILRMHEQTLYEKTRNGTGPKTVKIGSKVLIEKSDLEDFINGKKS